MTATGGNSEPEVRPRDTCVQGGTGYFFPSVYSFFGLFAKSS